MKLDATLSVPLREAAPAASALEATGCAGAWTAETAHDPFLPLALAAPQTDRIELGTSIAVAFARSPMLLANIGWDLQTLSRGRFVLGLGSQVEAHITRRFSMPWSKPAARMREFVLALRAIWASWCDGSALKFEGEFYRHTLMTPFFTPNAEDLAEFGVPPIYLAGVGERMTEVAGEVCDGFFCHSFTTERYLREVTLPALARGRATAGMTLEGFQVRGPGFVVTGRDERDLERAVDGTRRRIAFYASTPAYRPVLELHGWGDLQIELGDLARAGRWDDMAPLIDDEVLHAFAIVDAPEKVAERAEQRFGDVVSRIALYTPYDLDEEARLAMFDGFARASR